MPDERATLELLIESTSFASGLQEAESQFVAATNAMAAAAARVDFDPASAEAQRLRAEVVRTGGAFVTAARQAQTGLKDAELATKLVGTSVRDLDKNLKRFDSSAKNVQRSFGGVLRAAQQLRAIIPALGGALILRGAFRSLTDFQGQMGRVRAITGATEEDFRRLTDVAVELGSTTRFTSTQAAEGMEALARAGFNTNEVLSAIPGTLNLAAATSTSLGEASRITANAVRAFTLEASEAGRVADIFTEVTRRSNTDLTELADGMKFAAPVARALGISVEQTAAAVGVLSDAGLQASQAGTGLRRVFSELVNPSAAARKSIQALGLTVEELDPRTNSLSTVIRRLTDAGIDAASAFTIFGDRGAAAILNFTAPGNLDRLDELTRKLDESRGVAEETAAVMEDNLAGSVTRLRSAIDGLIQRQGEQGLSGFFKAITDSLTSAVGELDSFTTSFQGFVSRFIPGFEEVEDATQRATSALQRFTDAQRDINGLETESKLARQAIAFVRLFNEMERFRDLDDVTREGLEFFVRGLERASEELGVEIPKSAQEAIAALRDVGGEAEVVAEVVETAFDRLSEGAQAKIREVQQTVGELRTSSDDLTAAFQHLQTETEGTTTEQRLLSEEAQKLVKQFKDLGEEAPPEILKIADAFKEGGKFAKEFEETISGIQKSLQGAIDTLREETAAVLRDSGQGPDTSDREKNIAALRKEIDDLNSRTALSAEESARLSEAQSELFQAEIDLRNATTDLVDETDLWAKSQEEAAAVGKAATDVIEKTRTEVDRLKKAFPEASDAIVKSLEEQIRGFELQQETFGVTASDVEFFASTVEQTLIEAQREATVATDDLSDTVEGSGRIFDSSGRLLAEFGKQQEQLIDTTEQATDATDEFADVSERSADATEKGAAATERSAEAAIEATDAQDGLAESLDKAADATQESAEQMTKFRDLIAESVDLAKQLREELDAIN